MVILHSCPLRTHVYCHSQRCHAIEFHAGNDLSVPLKQCTRLRPSIASHICYPSPWSEPMASREAQHLNKTQPPSIYYYFFCFILPFLPKWNTSCSRTKIGANKCNEIDVCCFLGSLLQFEMNMGHICKYKKVKKREFSINNNIECVQ